MKGYVYRAVILAAAMMATGGCTSIERTFEGYRHEQVWTAMVAAAQTPAYADWDVAANDVWSDEAQQRIEIYRHLRRVLYRPGAEPHNETQTWRFEVRLERGDPPTASFVSRGVGLPTDARYEAKRFFLDVQDLLLGDLTEVGRFGVDDALLNSLGADEFPPATEDVDFLGPD